MATTIRLASPDDTAAMLEIYAPFVRDTATSFETAVPTREAFATRVQAVLTEAPWLVAESGDLVAGYAYAGRHRERPAYRWTREVSVYVKSEYHRHGVGRALYSSLLDLLRKQGYCLALAGITLPNPASIAFHEKLGFTPVGTYHRVGFKQGAFQDVRWYALILSDHSPGPIRPVREVFGESAD